MVSDDKDKDLHDANSHLVRGRVLVRLSVAAVGQLRLADLNLLLLLLDRRSHGRGDGVCDLDRRDAPVLVHKLKLDPVEAVPASVDGPGGGRRGRSRSRGGLLGRGVDNGRQVGQGYLVRGHEALARARRRLSVGQDPVGVGWHLSLGRGLWSLVRSLLRHHSSENTHPYTLLLLSSEALLHCVLIFVKE